MSLSDSETEAPLGWDPRPADAEPRTPEQLGFRALDLAAYLAEPPPDPDWLLEGYIEHGELAWLSGPGKSGKSMIALFLACTCLAGADRFLGLEVDGLDWVLYVDGENRERTVRRRVHLAGVPAVLAAQIDYRSVRGVDLGSPDGQDGLRQLIERPGRGLVVLDSLVALHRADEDKAGEVRHFVTGLRAIFEERGVTAIGLAHENRTGNMRGSLDWRNAVDTVLELRKDDEGRRTLKIGDRRDGPETVPERVFRFVERSGHLELEMTAAAPAPSRPAGKAEQLAERIRQLRIEHPGLPKAETARRLDYGPDHGTFKNAWAKAMQSDSGEGGKNRRAVSRRVPGRQGTPSIGGVPALPALPEGPAEVEELASGEGFSIAIERPKQAGPSTNGAGGSAVDLLLAKYAAEDGATESPATEAD